MSNEQPDSARHDAVNRRKLLFMFAFPALIVLAATLVYYTGIGVPHRTTNKGELLQPPQQIDDLQMQTKDGNRWSYATAKPGWSLLLIGPGSCDADCRQRLYLSRQIRTALGQDAQRVSRLYMSLERDTEAAFVDHIAAEHGDVQLLHADENAVTAMLARAGNSDLIAAQPLFIVDPRGFVMMYYLPRHTGGDILDDLRFLLKYSREG